MANGPETRRALAEALSEVLETKELAVFLSTKLLAALNRAGWRLVKKTEEEL